MKRQTEGNDAAGGTSSWVCLAGRAESIPRVDVGVRQRASGEDFRI